MKTKLLQLSEIVTTAGTQIRARIDTDTVDQYASDWQDGAKFPPVSVFHDGSEYILADGFHRVMAASRNGFKDIEADVHKGTKSDALKFALTANAAHGLKRTNADKRRSVELALAEWPKLSDRQLAEICAVSNVFVSSVHNELLTLNSSKLGDYPNELPRTRIGADGKERKLPIRKTPIDNPTEDEPPRIQTMDEEFAAAMGNPTIQAIKIEVSTVEYYSRLEALVQDAIENASDKQLRSMSVYAATIPRLIKEELRVREAK